MAYYDTAFVEKYLAQGDKWSAKTTTEPLLCCSETPELESDARPNTQIGAVFSKISNCSTNHIHIVFKSSIPPKFSQRDQYAIPPACQLFH